MTLNKLVEVPHVTGIKQVRKAIEKGTALTVFLAGDADDRVTAPLRMACQEKGIEVVEIPTMAELGNACAIEVRAAAAAILK